VNENQSAGTISVTQHRFFQDGSPGPEDDKTLYPLSLGLLTARGMDELATLYYRTLDIVVPFDFYKLNADHIGVFRVSYPPERLKNLGQNAKSGLLSPKDRIGMISDALATASSGHLNTRTSDVLSLLEQFKDESSFYVWKQILATISSIEREFRFESSHILIPLKAFKTRLVTTKLKGKGWKFNKGDDILDQSFKALLFANGSEDADVQRAAKSLFESLVAGDENSININILDAVFAIVLEHGGTKEVGHLD